MKTFYSYRNFLDRNHCLALIQRAENSRLYEQDATIDKQGLQKGNYRTSESFTLMDNRLLNELANRLHVERDKMERPLLIRYKEGGEFKAHVDFHIPNTEMYEERIRHGQRTLSFVFYLNDGYQGGELYFDRIRESLTPQEGTLAVIVNQWLDGSMNWESSHASLPIIEGTKYILLVNYTGKYQVEKLEQNHSLETMTDEDDLL